MNVTRIRYAQDWNAGTYAATSLDSTVNVSQYQHPAITPGTPQASSLAYSGARLYLAANATVSLTDTGHPTALSFPVNAFSGGAAAWSQLDEYAITTTAGDPLQFTTTAQTATFYLAGLHVSGAGAPLGQATTPALLMSGNNTQFGALTGTQSGTMTSGHIRNGAQVNILVNGVSIGVVDTYNVAQGFTIYGLTGSSVIEIYHNGTYNSQFQPWSAPADISGSSVAGNLAISTLAHPSFLAAQWRVVVTAGPTWKIQKNTGTPSSPVWTDQVTGLTIGAADTTHVPGLSVTLPSGPSYTVGDTAQFVTDYTMLALSGILFGFGSASGNGTYTSQVFDSGNQNTQWFLAEWNEPLALGANNFTFKVGNTSAPDGSWTSAAFTPSDTVLPSGARYGVAGLAAATSGLPRGRYGQFVLGFQPALVPPYVRDLMLYSWVPEQDTMVFSKLGFASSWAPGPVLSQFVGVISCHLILTYMYVQDWIASFARSAAVDAWLQGYGAEFGLTEFTGIPPQGFQAIVSAFFKSRPKGGSGPFIQQMMALLVLGPSGSPSAITLTQGGSQSYTLTIPAPSVTVAGALYYPGLPGVPTGANSVARAIITAFAQQINPLGANQLISFL